MARAVWTGSLSFGLVNVPVGVFSATEEKSIHFNQFQAGTSDRVRNKRVNERTGEEVPYDQIVKGYDLGGGEFVLVTPEELTALAPGRTKTIEVTDFVDLEDIDPVYFDRPYFLAPQGKGSDKAYGLLLEAMRAMKKVAIATFVMREKQYLVAVRPGHDALILETLRFADEVRDPVAEIDVLPVDADYGERELEMARMLIESMTREWKPDEYADTYREKVEQLIEEKRSGAVVNLEQPEAAPAPVVNLLEALQASVEAARGSRPVTSIGPSAKAKGTGRSKASSPAASASGSASSASKADLLRQAADLGIAGRSKMTREELEEAIEAATPKRRSRKAS